MNKIIGCRAIDLEKGRNIYKEYKGDTIEELFKGNDDEKAKKFYNAMKNYKICYDKDMEECIKALKKDSSNKLYLDFFKALVRFFAVYVRGYVYANEAIPINEESFDLFLDNALISKNKEFYKNEKGTDDIFSLNILAKSIKNIFESNEEKRIERIIPNIKKFCKMKDEHNSLNYDECEVEKDKKKCNIDKCIEKDKEELVKRIETMPSKELKKKLSESLNNSIRSQFSKKRKRSQRRTSRKSPRSKKKKMSKKRRS